MNLYNRHYLAFQAAQRLWTDLKDELPESEQNPLALLLLERYLTASDQHRYAQNLQEFHLLNYLRSRAAQYYEVHYQQPHHDYWQSLRLRSRLEIALVQTVGNNVDLLQRLMQWHSLRFAAAINTHLYAGKLLHQRDEPTYVRGAKMPHTIHLN